MVASLHRALPDAKGRNAQPKKECVEAPPLFSAMTSLQLSAEDELLERFLDAAARGDGPQVSSLLGAAPSLLDAAGRSGWTALMLAARNGHRAVAETLLARGCDRFAINGSAQTALDIAKFWGHRGLAQLLGRTEEAHGGGEVLPCFGSAPEENFFGRETLDRLSAKRTDQSWLQKKQSDPSSVFLLFSGLNPMVRGHDTHTRAQGKESRLCRFSFEEVKDVLQEALSLLVFLGVERRPAPSPSLSLSSGPAPSEPGAELDAAPAWFALSTDSDPKRLLEALGGAGASFPSAPNRDLLRLSADDAGVVAPARAVLAWHRRYAFCPTCGSRTSMEEAGYKRTCSNAQCSSLRGVHNTCYPRVDPVVIMLVIHPDGNQCLLGRKKAFPPGLFSCLAGFIEPGETVEAAARREVEEESGVRVGAVRYVSCQPWPMPSNLMMGCLAAATSTRIAVDRNEIEEARWFPRQQVMEALRGGGAGAGAAFSVPPRQTIAHQLIRHWLSLGSNL